MLQKADSNSYNTCFLPADSLEGLHSTYLSGVFIKCLTTCCSSYLW